MCALHARFYLWGTCCARSWWSSETAVGSYRRWHPASLEVRCCFPLLPDSEWKPANWSGLQERERENVFTDFLAVKLVFDSQFRRTSIHLLVAIRIIDLIWRARTGRCCTKLTSCALAVNWPKRAKGSCFRTDISRLRGSSRLVLNTVGLIVDRLTDFGLTVS